MNTPTPMNPQPPPPDDPGIQADRFEEMLHSVLNCPPADRDAFLEEAGAGDADLVRDVLARCSVF